MTSQQGTLAAFTLTTIKIKTMAQRETESKSFESLHLDHTLPPETEAQISRAEFPSVNSLSSTELTQHKPHFKLLQPEKTKKETQGETLCETSLFCLGTQTFQVYNKGPK